ncbi:ABC transporter ATP-binding protein [Streptomyces vinaceus]
MTAARALRKYLEGRYSVLILIGLLSPTAMAGTLLQPWLIREVIDRIGSNRPAGQYVAILVTLVIASAVLGAWCEYLLQKIAQEVVFTARRTLIFHMLRLRITEYDARRTGDLLSRIGADTAVFQAVITSGFFQLVMSTLTALGAASAMIFLDPVLSAVAGASLLAGLCIGLYFAGRIKPMSLEMQARIGDMTAAVQRATTAIRTIRANRAEERETAVVTNAANQAYKAGLRIARLTAKLQPVMAIMTQGSFLLVLAIGGARVASGAISVGTLIGFFLYMFFLVTPLGQFLNAYTQLRAAMGAHERINEIVGLPAESATITSVEPVSTDLEFRNVTFQYADAQQPTLKQVSFTVPAGTCTALVGPSGAGKSTLLALLERFYETEHGTISLGGVDIRHMSICSLRGRLGYVEQESPILAGTVAENLRIGNPHATDRQLAKVLSEVNINLRSDAEVGESGVMLSGGERQRLAIARILLADPDILLLDEPTSHLDARNENLLRAAIRNAARMRTSLVVAHRLSTVADADQIIVLDQGQVSATGTHAELLEASPLYREFAENQFLIGSE